MTVIDDPLGLPKKKMKRKAKAASSSLVIAQSHIGPHQAKQQATACDLVDRRKKHNTISGPGTPLIDISRPFAEQEQQLD